MMAADFKYSSSLRGDHKGRRANKSSQRSGADKPKVVDAQWDADSVKALRRHLGLTQQEMAEHLGTRQQTISEWERGLYAPRGASKTLLRLVAERSNFGYGTDSGS